MSSAPTTETVQNRMGDEGRNPMLSIIVCLYSNYGQFESTLKSLRALPKDSFEVVVSDSSSDSAPTQRLIAEINLEAQVEYLWEEPRGVYPAINAGLKKATGKWIYVLHSGDRLIEGSLSVLMSELQAAQTEIVLCKTLCMGNNKPLFKSHASKDSIFWPHQGVVVRADVHRKLGAYDERYQIVADQIFFHAIRDCYKVSFLPLAIAEYDLRGLSSRIDLRVRKEFWLVRKLYGVDPVTNFIWSYARPIIRGLIDRYLSPRLVDMYLKRKYGE